MGGALLLAAAVGLLVCVGWYLTGALGIESLALRVLAAYPAAWAGLVAAAALLSVPGWMSRRSLIAAVAALAVVSFVLDRRRRSRRGSSFPPRWNEALSDPVVLTLAIAVAAAGIYLAAVAFLTTPNDWDGLTYHETRALLWDQQGRVGYVPAGNDPRLDGNPPVSEIGLYLAMLVPRTERFAALPQFVALWASLLAVVLLGRRLGLSSPGGRVRRPRVRDAPGRPPARRLDPERSRRRVVPPRPRWCSSRVARGRSSPSEASRSASPCRRSSAPRSRCRSSSRLCSRWSPHDGAARAWSRAARACCSGRPGTSSISPRRVRSTGGSGTPPARPPTIPSAACSGRCGRSRSTSSTRRGYGARSSGVAVGVGAAMVVIGVILAPRGAGRGACARLWRAARRAGAAPAARGRTPRELRMAALLVQDRARGNLARPRRCLEGAGPPRHVALLVRRSGGRRDPRRRGCRDRRRSARGAAPRGARPRACAARARRRVRVHHRLRPVARTARDVRRRPACAVWGWTIRVRWLSVGVAGLCITTVVLSLVHSYTKPSGLGLLEPSISRSVWHATGSTR